VSGRSGSAGRLFCQEREARRRAPAGEDAFADDTRPYLPVRNATRPCSSGVRAARSTWPPSDGTTR
jgi:hypothetical protein